VSSSSAEKGASQLPGIVQNETNNRKPKEGLIVKKEPSTPGAGGKETMAHGNELLRARTTTLNTSWQPVSNDGTYENGEGKPQTVGSKLSKVGALLSISSRKKHQSISNNTHDEEEDLLNRLQQVTHHRFFEFASQFLIMANTVFIAFELDWNVQGLLDSDLKEAVRQTRLAFTILFAIELVLKIAADRLDFFKCSHREFLWNLTDTLLVVGSIVDLCLDEQSAAGGLTTAFRTVRFLRFTRIIQLAFFFKELRQLIQGILESLKSFFWCFFLSLGFLLLVAFIILQFVIIYKDELLADDNVGGGKDMFENYFKTLSHTAYSLAGMVTGGVSWTEAIRPLEKQQHWIRLVFVIYVAFTLLCIFNVMTAAFVERAWKVAKSNVHDNIMEEISNREEWNKKLKEVFNEIDEDGNNEVTLAEFVNFVDDTRVQAYFRTLGLNVSRRTAGVFYTMLDLDGDDSLTLEEFQEGCSQFVGPARQIDISRNRIETKRLRREFEDLKEDLQFLKSR